MTEKSINKKIENSPAYINEVFLRNIAESLPQYVFWKNADSVYLGCNVNFARLVGLDSPSDIIGKNDVELAWQYPGDTADIFRQADLEVMAGHPIDNKEEILILPNGRKLITLVSKLPIMLNHKKALGIVGYFSDITELKRLEQELLESQHREIELQAKQMLVQSAVQVSHDIRSPLAALNMVLHDSLSLPESQRLLVRHALQRINDIANNLLSTYRGDAKNSTAIKEKLDCDKPKLLLSLIDELITEKRTQIMGQPVTLDLLTSESAYPIFISVNTMQFKRVISNLLNNAIEAINDSGIVNVQLSRLSDMAVIEIIDNGAGIPPDVLQKLQQSGGTYGKAGGSGIGVSSALAFAQNSQGRLEIASEVGKGTTITLTLPTSAPPAWFQEKLLLSAGAQIIVLDDDESIHTVWDVRFHSFLNVCSLQHFYTTASFEEYLQHTNRDNLVCLVDYEILTDRENGLDLIERLGLAEYSFLVTSYEEETLIARTESLGVKMIPKKFSPYIAIEIRNDINAEHPILIFIDDDVDLTSAWLHRAKLKDITIQVFNDPRRFLKIKDQFDKNIPIYIDSHLGSGIKGEVMAKDLFEAGFKELYLASGYPAGYFGDLPWIKKFVGKEPPF